MPRRAPWGRRCAGKNHGPNGRASARPTALPSIPWRPTLAKLVRRETATGLEISTGVDIAVGTSDYRAVRTTRRPKGDEEMPMTYLQLAEKVLDETPRNALSP